MAYKTILAHCNDKARLRRVLEPAVEIAGAFEAHLTGLSITPPAVIVPAGMPGAPATVIVDDHCQAYRADNPEMKAAFEGMSRARHLAAEWRELEAGTRIVADVALEHAHAADLIVAAQTDGKWAGSGHLDVADRLIMGSGRPVLVIPNAAKQGEIGRRILVAWNARREAARAVFDALPLLQRAGEVKCIWVNPQSEDAIAQDVPAADICAALARHGVKCEAAESVRPYADVGRTLLACAGDFGADLLVMGCYGHSRLREFVLGGASEHVLRSMTIPVLMSH
jgi:nucleotide-binding universal stress UspA family protein